MIILDTNVVSEVMHLAPNPDVLRWMAARHPDELFATSISVAELWYGVDRLPAGRRRDDLEARVRRILDFFGPLSVPFNSGAAKVYGTLAARHPDRQVMDLQIAAIALARGAIIATRNVSHFERLGVDLADPWSA